jgi:hypothetical protein
MTNSDAGRYYVSNLVLNASMKLSGEFRHGR